MSHSSFSHFPKERKERKRPRREKYSEAIYFSQYHQIMNSALLTWGLRDPDGMGFWSLAVQILEEK